jgi:DNA helicase-2/ATP-dependent DNA helicase PcrA
VRNALAYVRLLFHPEDDVALLRVLNVPPRGIGATTVATLEARAKETGGSLWDVIGEQDFLVGKRFAGAVSYFRKLIEDLREERETLSPSQLIERVLNQSGYLDWVEQQDNIEHTSRADNLRELSNAMAEATEQGQTLEDLLDRVALTGDADEYDEDVAVSLMTLHSAKGLEFDAVYLAGLEEGLLPHSRSIDTNADIEEERRLFYVGMTRAKKSLLISRATYRRSYGEDRMRASLPSRFLAEIPAELIEAAPGSQSEPGETRRYEDDPEISSGYGYRSPRTPYGQGRYGQGGYGGGGYGGAAGRPGARSAAARPASSASTNKSSKDPLIGMRVRHSKYGVGTIIQVEGEGEDRKFTVSFQDHGPKKLLERYANLQLA